MMQQPISLDAPHNADRQQQLTKNPRGRRTVWRDLATRFADARECLASFLALESAEVVAGMKPANLFSIPNRTYPCGRNPYQLWKDVGTEVMNPSPLEAYELTDRRDSMLLLLYRRDALCDLLSKPAVRTLLTRAGYGSDLDLGKTLERIAQRLAVGDFPHEIGIFLGYPLKDVVGFMGFAPIPFTCQGPWKIYGNPTDSLRLAEDFRWCRRQMAAYLEDYGSPTQCLAGGALSSNPFFCTSTENNFQNQH